MQIPLESDSVGNVGSFSKTAVGWIEGGHVSQPAMQFGMNKKQIPLIEVDPTNSTSKNRPARDNIYNIALIEAHYLSLRVPVMKETPRLGLTDGTLAESNLQEETTKEEKEEAA